MDELAEYLMGDFEGREILEDRILNEEMDMPILEVVSNLEELVEQDWPKEMPLLEKYASEEAKWETEIDDEKMYRDCVISFLSRARQNPITSYLAVVPIRKRRSDYQKPKPKKNRLQEPI